MNYYTLCLQDYGFPLSLVFLFSLSVSFIFFTLSSNDLIVTTPLAKHKCSEVFFQNSFWLSSYPHCPGLHLPDQLIYCCVAPSALGSSSPGLEPLLNFFHISGTTTQPQPSLNHSSRSSCFQTFSHPSYNPSNHHQPRLLPQDSLETTGRISTGWL